MIAGIDYSTRAVDVVLLDEDTDAATWHRFDLEGADAFDRSRSVRWRMAGQRFFDDVLAIGIEDPRGYNAGALYRVQGAILGRLPQRTLVHPFIPSQWRKAVGLPGNATKDTVQAFVDQIRGLGVLTATPDGAALIEPAGVLWPQDACDAYCIALATRNALVTT